MKHEDIQQIRNADILDLLAALPNGVAFSDGGETGYLHIAGSEDGYFTAYVSRDGLVIISSFEKDLTDSLRVLFYVLLLGCEIRFYTVREIAGWIPELIKW